MNQTIKAYTELNNKTVVAFKGTISTESRARRPCSNILRSTSVVESIFRTFLTRTGIVFEPGMNSRNANNEF